jgi:hypothetical protein
MNNGTFRHIKYSAIAVAVAFGLSACSLEGDDGVDGIDGATGTQVTKARKATPQVNLLELQPCLWVQKSQVSF